MSNPKHFFVSYSTFDLGLALKLATDLKNKGIRVWIAKLDGNIRTSDDWRAAIEQALTRPRCTALIALISPGFVDSSYCRSELARAARLGIPIVPVYIHPIPDDKWPLELERLQYINFHDHRQEDCYLEKLDALFQLLLHDYPKHRIMIPDHETQYVNRLIGSLEAQRGVSNFIEPTLHIEGQDFRPRPIEEDEWGYSLLTSDADVDTATERKPLPSIKSAIALTSKFALLGDPGAGKTTILRRLALEAAQNHLSNPRTTPIPLLLNLAQWAIGIPFTEFIDMQWPLPGNPTELIDSGALILLLDGLNEMGSESIQKAREIAEWVRPRSPDAVVIVTCRTADYSRGLRIASLPIIEIHELTDTQIRDYTRKNLEDHEADFLRQIYPEHAGSQAGQGPHPLLQLARNPYLLSALIFIYNASEGQALPRNTGTLFQRLVQSLWRREELRKTVSLPFAQVQSALSRLAFSMIDSGMPIDVTLGYALFHVDDVAILDHGVNASLLIREDGRIRFYHQLVQEYFAALGLSRVGIEHINLPETSTHGLFDPLLFLDPWAYTRPNKWDQVIIALCGILPAPEEVIRRVALFDPALGIRCIQSGVAVDPNEVFDSFFQSAQSDDPQIRVTGMSSLGNLGDPRAIPFLVECLFDPDTRIQKLAGSALIHFGQLPIPALITALKTHPFENHPPLIQSLTQIGAPSIPFLLQEITPSSGADVVVSSCTALGRIGDSSVGKDLLALLRANDNRILAAAIWALGDLSFAPASTALIAIHNNNLNDPKLNIELARAFGKIHNVAFIPALTALLGSPVWTIHRHALTSLHKYVTDSADAAGYVRVFDALSSRSTKDKERAIDDVYDSFGVQGLLHSHNHAPRLFWELNTKLKDTATEDDLTTFLEYRDSHEEQSPPLRILAILANVLASWGKPEYAKYLVPQLESSSPFTVGLTIEALTTLKSTVAVTRLVELLENEKNIYSNSQKRICDAAASALVSIGDPDGIAAAKAWAMREIQFRIRQDQTAAIQVLGAVGDQDVIPRLTTISRYKDFGIRRAATKALEQVRQSSRNRQ